tara:strand:+ start:897 stop:1274 length:378 start_codon:yes stop_codon:yes gene_type:complete
MDVKILTLYFALINSLLIFVRRIFVINRYKFPVKVTHIASVFLMFMSGLTFWVSVNSIKNNIWTQITSGTISTILSWSSMIYLVNDEKIQLPSRQQIISLVFYILTELSVLIQARVVIGETECVQ